jgi:hypothetical protein
MEALFGREATGRLRILTLQDAFDKIAELEKRILVLEGGQDDH